MALNCENVKTIKDVTDQIDYIDRSGKGKIDPKWVSCGQSKDSELQDKYDEHFSSLNVVLIAKIMCKCCKKLKPTGTEKVKWSEFYHCMKSHLTIEKQPLTIKKLDELIKWHEKRSS